MSGVADHPFGRRLCELLHIPGDNLEWLAINVDNDGAVTVVTEHDLPETDQEVILREMAVYEVLLLERTSGGENPDES